METKYKRIIVKISGEALSDHADDTILDKKALASVAKAIKEVRGMGVEVGVVVGAGNIWRGRLAEKIGIERSTADYMGMLGTIINAMALQSAFEEVGLETRVMSSINVPQVCEPYIRRKAIHHLDLGRVVIFAGGTGNPYFTTDTTATLRAREVSADAILMGKNGVGGVFDKDPRTNKDAKLIEHLSYHELVEKKLAVMDLTAATMLEDTDIEIRVFGMNSADDLVKVVKGDKLGSTISKEWIKQWIQS